MNVIDDSQLLTVTGFVRAEPAISSDQSAYRAIREGTLPPGVVVRLGRRIFIDWAAWLAFKSRGGRALPGGWRREPVA